MMDHKQKAGRETSTRLLDWTRGQADAERLAGHLLALAGFESIDPSHPLGGPDRLKDARCKKDDKKWVAGFYFPRGQKKFPAIRTKFRKDQEGAARQGADGFVFVTNQELRVGERKTLADGVNSRDVEILHHERLLLLLDNPKGYAIRLEYLEVPMNREDQISFFAVVTETIVRMQESQEKLVSALTQTSVEDILPDDPLQRSVPLANLERFQEILNEITGGDASLDYWSPVSCVDYIDISNGSYSSGRIDGLRVPLQELREFKDLLDDITSSWMMFSAHDCLGDSGYIDRLKVPLADLKEFKRLLGQLAGSGFDFSDPAYLPPLCGSDVTIKDLRVPLEHLKEYEATLDKIIAKQKLLQLPPSTSTT